MRITLTQAGGIAYFPGLQKPFSLDVAQLPQAAREELQRLVAAARFFDLPAEIGVPARGAADYQHYTLTIEDRDRQHTVRVLVPIAEPSLDELIQTVQQHVRAAQAASRSRQP